MFVGGSIVVRDLFPSGEEKALCDLHRREIDAIVVPEAKNMMQSNDERGEHPEPVAGGR